MCAKRKFALLLFFHWPAENDFMGKQRKPFLGFGEISRISANQFVFSVRQFNQPRIAEAIEDFGRVYDAIYFHARERNGRGWTLAVPVKNCFSRCLLGEDVEMTFAPAGMLLATTAIICD